MNKIKKLDLFDYFYGLNYGEFRKWAEQAEKEELTLGQKVLDEYRDKAKKEQKDARLDHGIKRYLQKRPSF